MCSSDLRRGSWAPGLALALATDAARQMLGPRQIVGARRRDRAQRFWPEAGPSGQPGGPQAVATPRPPEAPICGPLGGGWRGAEAVVRWHLREGPKAASMPQVPAAPVSVKPGCPSVVPFLRGTLSA